MTHTVAQTRVVEALGSLILEAVNRGDWRRAKAGLALVEVIVERREAAPTCRASKRTSSYTSRSVRT